ncbi:metal-dependent hydrolase [Uliginosibacterium sp. H3]|uniref:Metal-dependent hydrolase n=1 Tax=Uliginosibacterium silvisoli TaxID=3114758 RepID=A0ABU6K772_9RHOO|nr:metal-dependent hydrolase [Uliginosibacterium sp. H3]
MNGPTHRLVAGLTVGVYLADKESKAGTTTCAPILAGAGAAYLTSLPDILEPATSPNHRQFFHSIAFATLIGVGLYKLNKWQPETDLEEALKGVAQLAGWAYLIHLALDFTTRKSLPLLGRI